MKEQIKDRILRLERIPGSLIKPHPLNWRLHPDSQKGMIVGSLASFGWVATCVVREIGDGTYQQIDGHARAEIVGDVPIPCVVVDLTEAEATQLLVTLDPISAQAEVDAKQLEAVLRQIQTDDESLAGLYTQLAAENGIIPPEDGEEGDGGGAGEQEQPQTFAVLIECADETQQADLLERLTREGYKARSLIA